MDTQAPQGHGRSKIGWIILIVVVLADVGLEVWFWPGQKEREDYDASGLNMLEAPAPEPVPFVQPASQTPAVNLNPVFSPSRPVSSTAFPAHVVERPEWVQAASSFYHLAQQSKYRRSLVLNSWAQDFTAYPDLRAIGQKYAWDHDLAFFTVSVLRSTNFAKMLKKYGSSPDVKNFYMDLMSAPGVATSSRALFEDPNVMNSVKDLTIPGMPSLGQMMQNGAQNRTSSSNNSALRKMLQDGERNSQ